MVRVCFVCLGNICRSPTAEGVFIALAHRHGLTASFSIESAGTAAYHVGERADPRTLATAKRRGVELPSVARRFERGDFARFDYVLAMDSKNHGALLQLAASDAERAKVRLLRSFCAKSVADGALDVPDPYYGGASGFEDVFDICQAACEGLLAHVRKEHGL
jgi:protein-tyrosine phosphatase